MRTIAECVAVIEKAFDDRVIAGWFPIAWGKGIVVPWQATVDAFDGRVTDIINGSTEDEFWNNAADYVESLYPKARSVDECKSVLNRAEADGLISDWMYYDTTTLADIDKYYCVSVKTLSGHWQDWTIVDAFQGAAEYVESLPKKATPEPLTCRCKRMKWCDRTSVWFDSWLHRYFLAVQCPDCNSHCQSTGAITYKDGPFTMLSTPYREEDLLESLRNQEATVTLEDAVKVLFNQFHENTHGQYIILWVESKDDKDLLVAVCDAICANPLNLPLFELSTVIGRPMVDTCERASMIVRVSGTPEKIELNIQKNRYGSTFNLHCTTEEKTVHPDSSSYGECFKVLREAKKDGVIKGWWMNSGHGYDYTKGVPMYDTPTRIGFYGSASDGQNDIVFEDDGTKGDIGILREAAAYAKDLRAKQPKPVEKMDAKMLSDEITLHGYSTKTARKSNTDVPTLTLYDIGQPHKAFPISIDENETLTDFLRRCVTHIRGQK